MCCPSAARAVQADPAQTVALLSPPALLDTLRAVYCRAAQPEEASGQLPDSALADLRESLLTVAFELLEAQMRTKLPGSFRPEDVQALLAFVGDCPDQDALQQVRVQNLGFRSGLVPHDSPGIPVLAQHM